MIESGCNGEVSGVMVQHWQDTIFFFASGGDLLVMGFCLNFTSWTDGCVESLPYRFSLEACSISDGGCTRNNSDYGCLNKHQQVQSQVYYSWFKGFFDSKISAHQKKQRVTKGIKMQRARNSFTYFWQYLKSWKGWVIGYTKWNQCPYRIEKLPFRHPEPRLGELDSRWSIWWKDSSEAG